MKHQDVPAGYIHLVYNWTYADSTARTAASGFASSDVGKLALQQSDSTLWLVTAVVAGVPTWGAVSGSGPQGAQGPQGSAGAAGSQGPQGDQGGAGSQGPQGAQGASGGAGSQGPQGDQGPQGSAGAQGGQGSQGNQGNQGNQGTQGTQGAQGDQGAAAPTTLTANNQTDSYTLVIGDAGKIIEMNKASACTLTIPANASVAFDVGTVINVYQMGAGQVTVAITTDTLRSPNGAKTAKQYSVVSLWKRAATEWVVSGDTAA